MLLNLQDVLSAHPGGLAVSTEPPLSNKNMTVTLCRAHPLTKSISPVKYNFRLVCLFVSERERDFLNVNVMTPLVWHGKKCDFLVVH